jgi:hypothetical protein
MMRSCNLSAPCLLEEFLKAGLSSLGQGKDKEKARRRLFVRHFSDGILQLND